MTSQTAINKAMKWALLGSAAIAVSVPAFAADDSSSSDSNVEKITVTGSRIKRTDMETASPVSIITAADIKKSGYNNVADFINDSTFSSGSSLGASTNNGSYGTATVNMRGLGANRTLILVNGRRMINSGTGADSSVDMNSIPLAMVDHIEVLKDGASAVYGSDAIAGVINIITKKHFQGIQVNGSYGGSGRGDANDGTISLLMGADTDKANVVIGASYQDRSAAMQSNRGWSSCARDGSDAGACSGSSYTGSPSVAYDSGVGYTQQDSSGNWEPQTSTYDYVPYQYLSTPEKVFSVFGNGSYQLTDNTSLFSEMLWTRRTSTEQLAPSPLEVTIPADATGNEWDTDVDYKLRATDLGPRDYSQVVNTSRYVIGAQGTLDIHNGLDWDVSYVYGRNDAVSTTSNLVNLSKMADTYTSSVCDDDSIPCVNWFDSDGVAEGLSYAAYTNQDTGGDTMNDVTGNISGDLFELPAGMFSFAAGLEYRRESGWYTPDSVESDGDSSDGTVYATAGSYNTTQGYVEFEIPILADKFLVKNLSLETAYREFNYSNFGSDNTWKIGLTWRVNDDLMLRGVRSTAFRAPSISELYGGNTSDYAYLTDPCSGYGSASSSSTLYQKCDSEIGNTNYTDTDTQIEVTDTSDPDLKPETANTTTLGLVWSPSFLEGFSATVDYYKIDISNAIGEADEQSLLDSCYDGNSTACSTLNYTRSSTSGEFSYVDRPLTNIGTENINGVDTNIKYAFNAFSLGWVANFDSSYMGKYEQDGTNLLNTISGDEGAYAKWKNNASLSVSGDNWDAKWSVRFIGNMHDLDEPSYKVGSMTYNDLSGSYHFGENTTVTVGVDNMFDRTPPYMPDYQDANTVPSEYDVLGRYFYTKFSWRL
ncbi:TonB-dependent receptor [Gallaecimonas mangrovi]|uniref:TonB-dependent receptor n=1 Tax=Gallaecimonas mangrovi TaxID=2291597 RepID=UPI000E208518|nr:TonB-dependent receptor [Gallaecimonas mangrovi]